LARGEGDFSTTMSAYRNDVELEMVIIYALQKGRGGGSTGKRGN